MTLSQKITTQIETAFAQMEYSGIDIERFVEFGLIQALENYRLDELLDNWQLSIRTEHSLKNEGIHTYRQLLEKSEVELLRIPNFGRKCLNEINAEVAKRGDQLKSSSNEQVPIEKDRKEVDWPALFKKAKEVPEGREAWALQGVLFTLAEREAQVLRMRFGLTPGGTKLEEIGQTLGTGRSRIRQIEAKALRKLRHPFRTGTLWRLLDT